MKFMNVLEFERPIVALSKKIEELQELASEQENTKKLQTQINNLTKQLKELKKNTYQNLNAWEKNPYC